MRLGESGADSLPRSIPVMRTYDAMTAAFPQTGFAHTVVVWSRTASRWTSAAVRTGVDELVAGADAHRPVRRPADGDGRVRAGRATATVDLPMTGDFNSDRAAGLARRCCATTSCRRCRATCRAPRSR